MCVHDLAKNGKVEELKDAVSAGTFVLSTTDDLGNSALMAALTAQQWDAAKGSLHLHMAHDMPLHLLNVTLTCSWRVCRDVGLDRPGLQHHCL